MIICKVSLQLINSDPLWIFSQNLSPVYIKVTWFLVDDQTFLIVITCMFIRIKKSIFHLLNN